MEKLGERGAFVNMPDDRNLEQPSQDNSPETNQGITDNEIERVEVKVRPNFAYSFFVLVWFFSFLRQPLSHNPHWYSVFFHLLPKRAVLPRDHGDIVPPRRAEVRCMVEQNLRRALQIQVMGDH